MRRAATLLWATCAILCGFLEAFAAGALPSFDFYAPDTARSWTQNDVIASEKTSEGLVLTITGPDPFIISPPADFTAAKMIYLRLMLVSDVGGEAQIFWGQQTMSEKDSLHLEVPAGKRFDAIVPLPALGSGWRLRIDPPGTAGRCIVGWALVEESETQGVTRVSANSTEIELTLTPLPRVSQVVEVGPNDTVRDAATVRVAKPVPARATTVRLPRFDGSRDRLYSGFARIEEEEEHNFWEVTQGTVRYVEEMMQLSRTADRFPKTTSKKGLQVQMVADALALGIQHSALNVNLTSLIELQRQPDSIVWESDGQSYFFRRQAVERIPVKELSDAGVLVNLIIFATVGGRPEIDVIFRHPRFSESPNHFTAFNTVTPEGLRYFKACLEFLADYFSQGDHGRVWGYIIGNEVDAHHEWHNRGRSRPFAVAEEYARTMRTAHAAIRKSSANARVYVSLTHHWGRVPAGRELLQAGGRELLEHFARCVRLGGDFDWHLAHHPYPENLADPRTWQDKSATASDDAAKVTFKNLEVLQTFFDRPEMLHRGQRRRIILSEQGFHCLDQPDGETLQAAAFCYAWEKVARLDCIDAFILHRHVDHAREGGLRLGLWSNKRGTISEPDRKRRMYDVFKACDSPEREQAFDFALPVIGLSRWDEVINPARE